MSNIPPIFMSGPRLKIKLDGVDVAHALGLNINVRKLVRHFHTMGNYGPTSVGTLLFSGVDGTLQIQRLNPYIIDKFNDLYDKKREDIAEINSEKDSTNDPSLDNQLRVGGSENIRAMFDPNQLLLTNTFEIEVYQSYPKKDATGFEDHKILTIVNCRLSNSRTNISLGQPVTEEYTFEGSYAKVFSNITGKLVESNTNFDATT